MITKDTFLDLVSDYVRFYDETRQKQLLVEAAELEEWLRCLNVEGADGLQLSTSLILFGLMRRSLCFYLQVPETKSLFLRPSDVASFLREPCFDDLFER